MIYKETSVRSNFFTSGDVRTWRRWMAPCLSAGVLLCLAQSAEAANYFISKNGNNTDGRTWQTAFNELDQVKWNTLQPTDSLTIDGGTSYMVYRKSLKVAKTGTTAQPFRIVRSRDAGHSGRVVIDGGGQPGFTAIDFASNGMVGNVYVDGYAWNGIEIKNCAVGTKFSVYYNWNDRVTGCDIHDNQTGAMIQGSNGIQYSYIHDNSVTNVALDYPNTVVYPGDGLTNCWVYNNDGRAVTDGVTTTNANWGGGGSGLVNCVLGPNLRNGINNTNPINLNVTGCLFLNAHQANIAQADYTGRITLNKCTSFMTNLNPQGLAHSALKLARISSYNNTLNTSIFYGGALSGNTYQAGSGNTQWRTTGSTSMVRGQTADPRFVSNVSTYPNNVPFGVLQATSFALQQGSPAVGTGAAVTSVGSLLGTRPTHW